eukprot:8834562-Prorocentrum_lima.AAC.1
MSGSRSQGAFGFAAMRRLWRDRTPVTAIFAIWRLIAIPHPLRPPLHPPRLEAVQADHRSCLLC